MPSPIKKIVSPCIGTSSHFSILPEPGTRRLYNIAIMSASKPIFFESLYAFSPFEPSQTEPLTAASRGDMDNCRRHRP